MSMCDRCGKVFQRRLHVAQHRRTHSEYRPYKCQFGHCLQSFPILSQLQIHQRIHIDHRRYHCRVCRVRFLRQSHLDHHKCQPHRRRVHKCHVCSATFLRIISLANHIYEQHSKIIKSRRLQCQQFLKGKHKKSKYKASDVENGDDSKILLKITLGKSMTIISPSKKSPNTRESKKKLPKKKSKKKRRKDDKKQGKKGIILSIKKGMVNVKDKRNGESKSKQTEKINGLNTEYKLGEQKSELKLTIKACPDLTVSPSKGETYKVLEKSDSRSSLKLEKRTSNGTDIDTMESLGIGDQSPHIQKDLGESKVRNGIVITKDKTGKFLAEQLPAVKPKKRDNVFESLNDVGIWKVLASPRDRPNDILKLKLSPQKPARIESTLEEACAYNASKYLDIPVNSLKVKGEASGEDSDILELLPTYDKESDGGMNNVNDSGIEVLSSSSCNRSNGNSVRSVVMEDNSPTYFNTEDSLLSLDSPLTEGMNRAEHSMCHKCGGIIMETNNNTRSPGKCRCNPSNPHSPFEMPISPVKCNILSPEVSDHNNSTVSSEQLANSKQEYHNEKSKDCKIKDDSDCLEHEKSDGEDSDIMIITFGRNQNNSEEGKSRLKLKLRPKDQSKSEQKSGMETIASPQKGKRNQSISPHKPENPKCAEFKKSESAITYAENKADEKSDLDSDRKKQGYKVENSYQAKSYDDNESLNEESRQEEACVKNDDMVETAGAPVVVVIDKDDTRSFASDKCATSTPCQNESNKQIRKKPLFKSKKSAIKDITNSSSSLTTKETSQQSNESLCATNDDKTLQNKKPLFKKRALSADGKSEPIPKKPCFKTQMSVPSISTAENMLTDTVDSSESIVKQSCSANTLDNKSELSEIDLEMPLKVEKSNIVKEAVILPSKTSVSKLCTIGLDEEDSLQDLSGDIIDDDVKVCSPVKKSQKPALSFDLYQQQFLSFISNTLSSNKSEEKKDAEKQTVSEKNEKHIENAKESDSNENEKIDNRNDEMASKANKNDNNEIKISLGTDDEVQSRSNIEGDAEILKSNKIGKKLGKKLRSQSKSLSEKKSSVKTGDKLGQNTELECNKDVNIPEIEKKSKVEKSDSLSWLTIFSDGATKENRRENESENAEDVMNDLSENLAEINKKIDVSKDEDTNSLDVDDVFQLENLSSLQPKHEINFSMSQTKKCAKEKPVKCEKMGHDPTYRRRQTAKRTVGKFKSEKRKIGSDYEYSDESSDAETIDLLSSHPGSDPDFNPFADSDEDFENAPRKRRESRTCVRVKKRTLNGSESSDSDNESKCSETDKLDSESQSSRSRRTKKGRKSSCPCCLGSPRKSFRGHGGDQHSVSRNDAYKLPRRHKQFVRSTLKLLRLQEKIHTLFLTLFPECAEMITHSNIGTEDFESLIDDVLNGLEDKPEIPFSSISHSVNFLKKDVENQFESCPASNIEMPFTASGSATRTSEIDLINASGDDRSPTEACLVQTVKHKSQITVDLGKSSEHTEDKYEINTAGKEIDAGISWQQSSLFNQTSLAASTSSSTSLKFENNTLNDYDEPMEESVYESVISHPSAVSESSLVYTQESITAQVASAHYSTQSEIDMINVNPVVHLDVLDHAEPFDNVEYYGPEVDSDPGVQSEITITLDLNAARVSLCRSPSYCLQKLHNQIIKLTKFFYPKLEFKNYFYKNIDNLEFLLDLMLEANSQDNPADRESENEMLEEEISDKWHHVPLNEINVIQAPIIKEDDTVKVNFLGMKNEIKAEEREPLIVKCSDLFEQEIKSQRESLMKDVFSLEEDKTKETWKSAEEVLNSISSLKKMARQTENAQRTRRPRDCRLRKRSADEKRTLFVQEKLQNSQNSTFVCDTKARSGKRGRPGRKPSRPENSKKRFLSELNLSDKLVSEGIENKLVENTSEKTNGHVLAIDKQRETRNKSEDNLSNKSEKVALTEQSLEKSLKDRSEAVDSTDDTDSSIKAGVKNIFELMQPS
ncbi:uncharacterized protein LOC123525400 [Mercenaria mercenaria]|uniref:uncharacterized protein LOC123525400 n=1 Tax=Mercenaria mercenaria TaxID=6596 RepID=UPI00234EC18E|nr:uncharacterized protein LOC123525400 [Mercenaria mercenaria]